MKLLTSDESDDLLRIRHTVRARRGEGGDEGCARAGAGGEGLYERRRRRANVKTRKTDATL